MVEIDLLCFYYVNQKLILFFECEIAYLNAKKVQIVSFSSKCFLKKNRKMLPKAENKN